MKAKKEKKLLPRARRLFRFEGSPVPGLNTTDPVTITITTTLPFPTPPPPPGS